MSQMELLWVVRTISRAHPSRNAEGAESQGDPRSCDRFVGQRPAPLRYSSHALLSRPMCSKVTCCSSSLIGPGLRGRASQQAQTTTAANPKAATVLITILVID